MSKIILKCIKFRSKMRVRFENFIDEEGKVYSNVYNDRLNCKFPRALREPNRFYEIGPNDLTLVSRNGSRPFYQVNVRNIKIIPDPSLDFSQIKVYEITECVVCMSDNSTEILAPCGHRCMCKTCSDQLLRVSKKCPICRREVLTTLSNNTIEADDAGDD